MVVPSVAGRSLPAAAAALPRRSLLLSVGAAAISAAVARAPSPASYRALFVPASGTFPLPAVVSRPSSRAFGARGGGRAFLGASSPGDDRDGEARTGWLHGGAEEPRRTQLAPEDRSPGTAAEGTAQGSAFGNFGGSTPDIGAAREVEEPATGWLHNTEPKQYSSPDYYPGYTDEISSTMVEQRTFDERMNDFRNHRILGPPAVHPCGDDRKRMMVTEHKVAVPLVHPDLEAAEAAPPSDSIVAVERVDGAFRDGLASLEGRPSVDVYFTVIELVSDAADEAFAVSLSDPALTPRARAERYVRRGGRGAVDASRMIAYLQGGPGFGCAAPVSGLSLASSKSSWASSALFGDATNLDGESFERVVLMDQRGTGRSSPITQQRLRRMFPDMFLPDGGSGRMEKAVDAAAEHLVRFRADSIVRDAEWVKEALLAGGDVSGGAPPSPQPWGAALGQSFGGFCLMTYLSSVVRPPSLCLLTGGIAPMNTPVREVYDRLWQRVQERNRRYYERYPGDAATVKRIVRRLLLQDQGGAPVVLPSGGILTARRFLQLGLALGGSPGAAFANLHSVINLAFLDEDDDELSTAFLKRIDYEQSFDDAPLYFLLHESIYADGPSSGATGWAAHASIHSGCEVPPHLPYGRPYASPNPEFDFRHTSRKDVAQPTLFFGEMVFPWMAEGDFAELSGPGMRSLAEALARKADWAPLFDAANMRAALLGDGDLPRCRAASATYFEDMYVDFDCAMKLVQRGAPLEGVKVWVTNEYQHSGLRDDGSAIVCKLVSMAKGSIHVPS